MACPAELIAVVRTIVKSSLAETDFLEQLPGVLTKLREAYRLDRNGFDAATIAELRTASSTVELVREFLLLLEDAQTIRTKADAAEYIARFELIATGFGECEFSLRALKEMRELLERYGSLPDEEALERQRLVSRPPACPRCSLALTLRVGSRGLFWGCRSFPRCFGTLNLTPEQARLLQSSDG